MKAGAVFIVMHFYPWPKAYAQIAFSTIIALNKPLWHYFLSILLPLPTLAGLIPMNLLFFLDNSMRLCSFT